MCHRHFHFIDLRAFVQFPFTNELNRRESNRFEKPSKLGNTERAIFGLILLQADSPVVKELPFPEFARLFYFFTITDNLRIIVAVKKFTAPSTAVE